MMTPIHHPPCSGHQTLTRCPRSESSCNFGASLSCNVTHTIPSIRAFDRICTLRLAGGPLAVPVKKRPPFRLDRASSFSGERSQSCMMQHLRHTLTRGRFAGFERWGATPFAERFFGALLALPFAVFLAAAVEPRLLDAGGSQGCWLPLILDGLRAGALCDAGAFPLTPMPKVLWS